MKKIILFFFLACIGSVAMAQDSTKNKTERNDYKNEKRQRIDALSKQEEEGVLSYTRQTAFGIQLRNNGYGVFLELGRRRSPRFANTYSLELTEIKHAKEEKLGEDNIFGNSSFVYGKINNFYQAKLGYGKQYIFGQKGNKNGVAVIGSLQGGLSLGLLKPYYLRVYDNSTQEEKEVKYTQQDSIFFVDGPIIGTAGFSKGWSELKLKPGLYLKTALRFDFGRYNESITAIEIGLSAEAYSDQIQMMLFNDPKRFFIQGHLAFVFGGRK